MNKRKTKSDFQAYAGNNLLYHENKNNVHSYNSYQESVIKVLKKGSFLRRHNVCSDI